MWFSLSFLQAEWRKDNGEKTQKTKNIVDKLTSEKQVLLCFFLETAEQYAVGQILYNTTGKSLKPVTQVNTWV